MKVKELNLPLNCECIAEDAQRNYYGGYELGMNSMFLDKATCMLWADKFVSRYNFKNISVQDLAIEFYAHAYVYYNMKFLSYIPSEYLNSIYNSAADGIQFEDGLDSRQKWFRLIWNMT